MMENKQVLAYDDQSKTFFGVRFVLFGFDSVKKEKIESKLVEGGAVDAVDYGPECTHVIVDKLVYDDPICVAARGDGKTLVSGLWVDHSFDVGMPVDPTSVMYRPIRDLNGIPGAKSLIVCLTGYQRQDRDDIMTMVSLMGANFSKPLVANKVTHLICYKFEGEKYELAKKMKKIKLVNHRWLEDCLKAWEILPESDYARSGYELEMETEAKDSEEETEDVASIVDVRRKSFASPQITRAENKSSQQSPVTRNSLYASASKSSANIDETSKFEPTPRKEADFERASHSRGKDYRHVEMPSSSSALTPRKLSSDEPSNMFNFTMNSGKSESILASASESAKKSPGANVSKLNSKVILRSPSASGRTERNSDSPSASNMDEVLAGGGSRMPLETHKDGTDGVKTPLKRTSLQLEERQTASLQDRRKTTLSLGSPHSTRVRNDLKTLVENESAINPKEVLASEISIDSSRASGLHTSTITHTRHFGEEASFSPKEALKVPVTSNDRQESNEEARRCYSRGLKRRILCTNLDDKDLCLDRTDNSTGEIEMHQSDMQCIEPPFPRDDMYMVEKSNEKIDLNISKVEHTVPELNPLKRQKPAKKTLGSRPSIANGAVAKLKGSINLQKSVLQNENIYDSNGVGVTEGTDSAAVAEKVGLVFPTNTSRSPAANIKHHEATLEDRPVGDEAKAQDDKVGCDFDKANKKEKFAEMEVPHPGEMRQETRVGVAGTGNQSDGKIIGSKSKVAKSLKDINDGKAEEAGCNKKIELAKPKPTGDDAEKKSANEKKRPLAKSKTKKVEDSTEEGKVIGSSDKEDKKKTVAGDEETVALAGKAGCSKKIELAEPKPTGDDAEKKSANGKKRPLAKSNAKKVKYSTEEGKVIGSSDNTDKKKTVAADEETVALAGKTKKRPSKKLKSSPDAEKENDPVTVDHQSMSNDTGAAGKGASQLLKKSPRNGLKAGRSDTGSVKGGQDQKVKTEPTWFILTGHRLQRKEFQQVIKRLRGRVCRDSHNWSYQATHLVVPDPIRRTEKFFAAAASGSWILTTDYLSASNEAGKLLSEEPYEWHKKGLSEDGAINLEAPRKWRLLRERTGHGAFYGMRIIIYGECIAPPLDTLKRVIKAGEGTILATAPPYNRFFQSRIDFAIVSPGMPRVDMWVQEFLRHEVPCILADYLVEYVCKPGYSLERHVQYNTHTWAEKSLKNLVSRIEEVDDEVRTPEADNDLACQVCESRDRGEEMLICGDESGALGCGVGIHFDCLDPPLKDIPEEDWFCSSCSGKSERKKSSNKRKSKSKK